SVYSPTNGRSVPASRRTWNSAGDSSARQSSSLFATGYAAPLASVDGRVLWLNRLTGSPRDRVTGVAPWSTTRVRPTFPNRYRLTVRAAATWLPSAARTTTWCAPTVVAGAMSTFCSTCPEASVVTVANVVVPSSRMVTGRSADQPNSSTLTCLPAFTFGG